MKFENIKGSIVAMVTPFREDGSVNFAALTECLFERACAYLEKRDSTAALADCLAADELDKAYRSALRDGEKLTSEALPKLRELKASLRA